jgi:hypothetical protein
MDGLCARLVARMDNIENSVATPSDRLDMSVNCTPGSYYTALQKKSDHFCNWKKSG